MAVNWQTINIPFGGGINTKTNPRRLQPPELEDLQNLTFRDAPGYTVRYGSAVAASTDSNAGTISACDNLATFRNELVLFGGGNVYSYSPDEIVWKIVGTPRFPKVTFDKVTNTPEEQVYAGVDQLSNIRVTATELSDTVGSTSTLITVTDTLTGTQMRSATATSFEQPQVIASASNIYVFGLNKSGTDIEYYKVNPADPDAALPSSVTFTSDLTATAADQTFCVFRDPSSSNDFIVVYRRVNGGTQSIAARTFDASTDSIGSVVDITTDAVHGVAEVVVGCANASFAFFGGAETGTGEAFIYRSTLSLGSPTLVDEQTGIATVARCAISTDPSGTANVPDTFIYELDDGTLYHGIVNVRDGDFSSSTTNYGGSSIASNGFFDGSANYYVIRSGFNEYTGNFSHVLVQAESGQLRTVAHFNASLAADFSGGTPPQIFQNDAGNWVYPSLYKERVSLDRDEEKFSARRLLLVSFDFDAENIYQNIDTSNGLAFLGGNMVWHYAGGSVYMQNNFLRPPYMYQFTGGNGSLGTGSYNYRAYLEYYDYQGNKIRSPWQIVDTVSGSTGYTIDIATIGKYQFEQAADAHFSVYRAEEDADVASGAPFYRVSSYDPSTSGGNNGYVGNDLTTEYVQFIDVMSDADLITQELDPANTNELDNIAPPNAGYIANAKGRLWIVDTLHPDTVYFTKLLFQGDVFSFALENTIQLPPDNDPDGITAIAELNHHVVFFKSESIYVVSGNGPDNLGRGFFNEPQRVTSDVGCAEPRSVVTYDGGVLFKSDKGIYRLGQNLQLDYIGAPVEGYNSQDITAATLVNDQNQIRFLTSSGRMLVFDYLVNQWTTFTGWTGISAVNWRYGDVYVWAESDGTVHSEDQSTYEDNGTPVDWSFTTAPISLQGIGGFMRMQRVLFEGDFFSRTNFEVTPYYDGASTGTEASVDTNTLDSSDPFRVVFNLPRQKFSDVKFKVTADKNNVSTSQGISIQNMRAKVGYKPGLDKLSDGNKFGS